MAEEEKSKNHLKRIASDELKKTHKAFAESRERYILAAKNYYGELMGQYMGALITHSVTGSGIIIDYEFEIAERLIPQKIYDDEGESDIVFVKIHILNHYDHKFSTLSLGSSKFTVIGKVDESYRKQLNDQRIQEKRAKAA